MEYIENHKEWRLTIHILYHKVGNHKYYSINACSLVYVQVSTLCPYTYVGSIVAKGLVRIRYFSGNTTFS